MKRWMIGLSLTTLVLSYQNCGAPPEMGGSYGENSLKSAVEGEGSVEAASWTGLEFTSYPEGSRFAEKYHIDLDTGEIISESSLQGKVDGESLCLSEDELSEIRAILQTSSVCEPEQSQDPNQMCTMEYQLPYAWLVSEQDKDEVVLALGEKANGCVKPTDLCGDHADLLKGFIASVSNSLSGRSCN